MWSLAGMLGRIARKGQFAMLGTEERVLQLRVLPRGPVLDGMWGLGSLRPSLVDTKTLKKRL